jgi:hypothetical protein
MRLLYLEFVFLQYFKAALLPATFIDLRSFSQGKTNAIFT